MNLAELVDPRSVDLALAAADKSSAIEALVDLLDKAGAVRDARAFTAAVLDREKQFSTGLGDGIAIPHGKSDGMTRPAVAFARSTQGIDWESASHDRARLIFLIGVPQEQAGDLHLRILAMLSRKLVHADFRQRLLDATSVDELLRILEEVTA